MNKLCFDIIKDGEVTENNLTKWSIEVPKSYKTIQALPNNLFGVLGENIGKNILKQDFYIDKRMKGRREAITDSHIQFRTEEVLRESLFLVSLLYQFKEIKVKSKLSKFIESGYQAPEKSYQESYSWKDNRLDLGPFELLFEPTFLKSLKKQFIDEYNIKVKKNGFGATIRLSNHTTLSPNTLISFLCPKNQDEFQNLKKYRYKRRLSNWLLSFLGRYQLIDGNEYIAANFYLLDLELDLWGIPKPLSDIRWDYPLFAIDVKSRRILCSEHSKYQYPSLYDAQRDYVKSLLSSQIGVLILTIQFCKCGEIFYKYLVPERKG